MKELDTIESNFHANNIEKHCFYSMFFFIIQILLYQSGTFICPLCMVKTQLWSPYIHPWVKLYGGDEYYLSVVYSDGFGYYQPDMIRLENYITKGM